MARFVVQLAFDGDPRRLAVRPAHREHHPIPTGHTGGAVRCASRTGGGAYPAWAIRSGMRVIRS
ncbi:hypothetical protein LDL49_37260 [Nonomuraea sp. NEAU-L178]|nr:hypothetical protein [Nonomuraea aurantiaca]